MQSLKEMHLKSLPISQRWLIYKGDEWEVFARLTRMSSMLECKRVSPKPANNYL